MGTLHRCNGFILNKLCVLLPYTYPTPKLSPHRRLCASLDFSKKHHLVCFLSLFEYGDIGSVLIKHLQIVNTSVIPMLFIQICVLITHINPHTHTYIYTHTFNLLFYQCLKYVSIRVFSARVSAQTHTHIYTHTLLYFYFTSVYNKCPSECFLHV